MKSGTSNISRSTCALLLAVAACGLLSSCSDLGYSGLRPAQTKLSGKVPPATSLDLPPWQVWGAGELPDEGIVLPQIKRGDQIRDSGDKRAALRFFQQLSAKAPKRSKEGEAAAVRAASILLDQNKASESILLLSSYFKRQGTAEREVTRSSALLLGYSYGAQANYEQAFAWFNQVLSGAPNDRLSASAEQGAALLASTIPDAQFAKVQEVWRATGRLDRLIGQEAALRQRRPVRLLRSGEAFWILPDSQDSQAQTLTAPPASSSFKFLALLPLSGKYAAIGRAEQAGMELAAEAYRARGLPVELIVEDEVGDASRSAGLVRQHSGAGLRGVLGPLLSENSAAVANVGRELGIPVLLLSKSESAPLGAGVARFGLTLASQADSLMQALQSLLPRARIALIFPYDETGTAFAEQIRSRLNERGLSLTYERSYAKGSAADINEVVSEFESRPSDIVFFGDNIRAASQFFAALPSQLRSHVLPVSGAFWDSSVELSQSRTAMEGAVFTSAFPASSPAPEISEFTAAYKAKTAKSPDFFAAQGYDALSLALSVAERNPAENLYSALAAHGDFQGVSGLATGSLDGEVQRRLHVMQFIDGQIVPFRDESVQPLTTFTEGSEPL